MATATSEAEKHLDASRVLLHNAQAKPDRDDVLQVSEKAWGTLAHYIRPVADE